ncbi:hypothetical protein H5410_047287 [Solanum commersonii]|uniref:Uncharacterized protein n=1 Tax=Solanum commersonii TaxID=4109 RepID=A0A9J5XGN9_SOLCO|nr:hypothetical protein H5410_047287 [Solanum commersonii]
MYNKSDCNSYRRGKKFYWSVKAKSSVAAVLELTGHNFPIALNKACKKRKLNSNNTCKSHNYASSQVGNTNSETQVVNEQVSQNAIPLRQNQKQVQMLQLTKMIIVTKENSLLILLELQFSKWKNGKMTHLILAKQSHNHTRSMPTPGPLHAKEQGQQEKNLKTL